MSLPTDISGIQGIAQWFQAAVPEPTDANIHTQLGVHFEEVAEMIDQITPRTPETDDLLIAARSALKNLSKHLKGSHNSVMIHHADRVDFLDALCDQIVTAVGCAHMDHMSIVGAIDEVNRSNFSKFDINGNPIFDENLKVAKGPLYSKAQLTEFAV